MTDFISNLLDMVRVRGSTYFCKNLRPPWGLEIEPHADLCRFHLVLAGSAWIGLSKSGSFEKLDEGDIAIIPRGQAHFLDDEAGRIVRTVHQIPGPDGSYQPELERLEYNPDTTHLLCGYFQFSQDVPSAILSRLPTLLIVRKRSHEQSEQMTRLVALLAGELSKEGASSIVVLNRLSEVVFYYTIRNWLDGEVLPGRSMHALTDFRLQRVLAEIHQNPSRTWTVEDLSVVSGQSRTAFANLFKNATGLGPITYLTHWRAQLACRYLRESNLGLDEIAAQTGYRDTNSFSRAFKRATGWTPVSYRRMLPE